MPSTIPDKTTLELWAIVKDCEHPDRDAAIAEIENYRVFPPNYPVVELRGGLSPTRRP